MDRRCGSNNRVPALQVQSPKFKLQSDQEMKKKKERKNVFVYTNIHVHTNESNYRLLRTKVGHHAKTELRNFYPELQKK
jgi:hypothetical protein